EHVVDCEVIGESEDTTDGDKFDLVSKLEAMTEDERFIFTAFYSDNVFLKHRDSLIGKLPSYPTPNRHMQRLTLLLV
ncbi:MAG: hypothetical protein J1E95_05490, partial [Muribaculaceae bacterium]|nr:hypothetical protein [Muribaculaceae bacterium]